MWVTLDAPADHDAVVTFKTNGGTVSPEKEVISRGSRMIWEGQDSAASVKVSFPGVSRVTVEAHSDTGLSDTIDLYRCTPGKITRLDVEAPSSRIPVIVRWPPNSALTETQRLVTVVLRNGDTPTYFSPDGGPWNPANTPAHLINTELTNVGQIKPADQWFSNGDSKVPVCTADYNLSSYEAGPTTFTARMEGFSGSKSFLFYTPLGPYAPLLVLIGGTLGGIVQISQSLRSHPRRRPRLVLWTLASSAIVGLATFLAAYVGVFSTLQRFAGGYALWILIGMVGGFAGPKMMRQIQHLLFWRAMGIRHPKP